MSYRFGGQLCPLDPKLWFGIGSFDFGKALIGFRGDRSERGLKGGAERLNGIAGVLVPLMPRPMNLSSLDFALGIGGFALMNR